MLNLQNLKKHIQGCSEDLNDVYDDIENQQAYSAKDAQMRKIEEEKRALSRQLIVLIILSFFVSAIFYGITMA